MLHVLLTILSCVPIPLKRQLSVIGKHCASYAFYDITNPYKGLQTVLSNLQAAWFVSVELFVVLQSRLSSSGKKLRIECTYIS
jgi:hypothetical protein